VRPSGTLIAATVILSTGLLAETVSAQNRARWNARQARWQAIAQAKENRNAARAGGVHPNAGGVGAGKSGEAVKPGERAMEGMPPKWLENLREMPPEEQQRFLQNNQRFQSLAPERQEQIRRNLEKWNSLTPEQRQAIRDRERVLEQMSPDQRQFVRDNLLPRWQQLPMDRRQAIRGRLRMLQRLTPAEREAALNDPRFMKGLNPDEQSLLRDLNSLRNPPPK